MSRFEPVFLDEDLGNRASMTFLRHANRCMRSGFLYAKHRRRGVQTVEMVRGSAAHAIHERGTNAMIDADEPMLEPDVVKAIVAEVLEEYPVPLEEHDYLREYAYRWAAEWRLRPDEETIAVERLFVLELAGWDVRCKVDFASKDAQNRLYVADYKSGRGAPPYDDITRKRTGVNDLAPAEQRLAAKTFQLVVYVLAVVFGEPVTVTTERCRNCESWPETGVTDLCTSCAGSGFCRVETRGEQVARGCQEAIAEYVFPGIEDSEGRMLRRTMGLTRLEMLEYRESLESLLRRVARAEQDGDWQAVTSDQACGECPCMVECPIPSELRDFQGKINTREEAADALSRRHVRVKLDRALGRELRAFSEKVMGGLPLRYGDRVAEIVPRESTEIRPNRDALIEALAGGMPAEEARAKFVRVSKGTSFVERDLTAEEIEREGAADADK